jgi:hypothetical protein
MQKILLEALYIILFEILPRVLEHNFRSLPKIASHRPNLSRMSSTPKFSRSFRKRR